MVELKRRSDKGAGQLPLAPESHIVIPSDPIETHYRALLNEDVLGDPLREKVSRLNLQISKTKEIAELKAQVKHLTEAAATLYKNANFDKLTGLANQRLLEEKFAEAVSKDEKIVLLFIDLNKFKQINDTYGHDVGDEALQLASKTLASLTRSTDLVAHIDENHHLPVRYAGDEFIILFTGTTLDTLDKKIASVKAAFSNLTFEHDGHVIAVGASIGAYERKEGDSLETCKKQADKAMYKDKEASRQDSALLPFGRHATGYNMPASTGYIPTTTGYPSLSNYGALKFDPK